MDRKIPVYFDTVIIDSPIQQIENTDSNGFRLKVGVFTKYKNRNRSYITDEYAQHLIETATRGNIPVVGFFDPETQTWASHTGPTLANGYGYVESFIGWEPFTDSDGVSRDYAVFSVVLFTKYFDEAQKVRGQNQSMELDVNTIEGDWANFDGEDYFVYTKGDMFSFCIIGSHEPCFSVSSFFQKNDEQYKSQYEKFSSLLSDLKTLVEEAEKFSKGGEQPMEGQEKEVVVEEVAPLEVTEQFEENSQAEVQPEAEVEQNQEFEVTPEAEVESEANAAEPTEYEILQQQHQELQTTLESLQADFTAAQTRISELETELEQLRTQNTDLQTAVQNYEAAAAQIENQRKEELVNKYSEIVDSAEIDDVRANINNFSYEALESKLAISFANKQLAEKETARVPLPEQESPLASLLKKYKK